MGVGTGLFNMLENLFHWFFGFEYWYISRETSSLVRLSRANEGTIKDPEAKARFYAIIKWTGIVLNVSSSAVLGYYEWRFENDIYLAYTIERPIPQSDVIVLLISEYVVILLMLVSTLFLADALRRFKNQATIRKNIVLNHNLMCVHVSVVTLQIIVSFVLYTVGNLVYALTPLFNILATIYSFLVFAI